MPYHLTFTELGQYQIYSKLAQCVTVTKRNRHTLLPLLLASTPISEPAQMFVQQTDPAQSEPFPACPSPRLVQSSARLTTQPYKYLPAQRRKQQSRVEANRTMFFNGGAALCQLYGKAKQE